MFESRLAGCFNCLPNVMWPRTVFSDSSRWKITQECVLIRARHGLHYIIIMIMPESNDSNMTYNNNTKGWSTISIFNGFSRKSTFYYTTDCVYVREQYNTHNIIRTQITKTHEWLIPANKWNAYKTVLNFAVHSGEYMTKQRVEEDYRVGKLQTGSRLEGERQ